MYIVIFGLIFTFIFIEYYNLIPKSNRSFLFVIMFIALVCHDGLRWNMGTDFEPYLDNYKDILSYKDVTSGRFEYLYQLSVYYIKLIFHSYTAFLLFHAIFIYSLYLYSLKKATIYPFIAILFLYVTMIGMLGSNRQNIALALCFFSIKFIIEKKPFLFLLMIALAFGFHKTSIVFLPVLFLDRFFNKKILISAFLITVILSFSSKLLSFFEIFTQVYFPSLFEDKADAYLLTIDEVSNTLIGTIFGLIRKGFPVFMLLFYRERLKSNNYFNLVFNLVFISLLMYIAFNNNLQFLLGRLSIYFSIFECIVYSWILIVLRKQKANFFILIMFFVYSVILFFRSIAIYPEIFIPYKSILNQ